MNYDTRQLREDIRAPYAWPGGYPRFFITSDGGALCHACARSEYRSISTAIRQHLSDGWRVEACDVNWEDNHLICDHCGEGIECAYPADNLDCMDQAELRRFADNPHNEINARGYAEAKLIAVRLRLAGDIASALEYEQTCEEIYQELPAHLQW